MINVGHDAYAITGPSGLIRTGDRAARPGEVFAGTRAGRSGGSLLGLAETDAQRGSGSGPDPAGGRDQQEHGRAEGRRDPRDGILSPVSAL